MSTEVIHLSETGYYAGRRLCLAQDGQSVHAVYAPLHKEEYRQRVCPECLKSYAIYGYDSSGYGINAGQYSGLVYVSDTGLKYALASTFSFGNAVFQTGNVTVNAGSVKFDLPAASLELPFVKSGSYMSGC